MRLPQLANSDTAGVTGSAGGPVYRQIADHIRREIEAGELIEGERLPPIRGLAQDLEVNRDTVALAYESLATEGWIESVVGRGTFVQSRRNGVASATAANLQLAPDVDHLLDLESARPRYGDANGVVPLHSLVPDPAFYPVESFRKTLNRVIQEEGAELFLYGSPQGHPGLREVLAMRFRNAGIPVGPEELVLCHGASQGISLALRLFARAGDAVAVEVPTYHNVLATLAALGVRAEPVPTSESGPDLKILEDTLQRPEVKAFYTIPSFHNPLGTTMPLERRRQLLDVASRCNVPIIEDAFEMDLRYQGRQVPPLAALDQSGLVVHLFSFSKSLFPGARVGSLAAHGRAVEGLLALKHASDLSDALPLQAALDAFVRAGSYDRHLNRMRRILQSRRNALMAALTAEMPAEATWTRPDGGYQVWLDLGFDVDTRDLLADAARAGVLFAPGSLFLPDRRPSRCLRLTVAQADEDQIRRGIKALGDVVRKRRQAIGGRRPAAGVHL